MGWYYVTQPNEKKLVLMLLKILCKFYLVSMRTYKGYFFFFKKNSVRVGKGEKLIRFKSALTSDRNVAQSREICESYLPNTDTKSERLSTVVAAVKYLSIFQFPYVMCLHRQILEIISKIYNSFCALTCSDPSQVSGTAQMDNAWLISTPN